ncbi:uncharacterized protein LOC117107876 [Anneissia japonica]|uniref:uncharacterized protein LOC117107876 n=1 Tax=Anneissia japonica TaxID=1529436 RepID=UPI0014255DC1|nr:uncharacterized protein LOC117107876 [Anneissia japonica]
MKLLTSKLKQNPSFHVDDEYVHFTKSDEPLNLRSKINNDVLDLKMCSLPFLKLIILGKLSSSLMLSLIGGSSESELKRTSDVTTCGYVDVKQCNNNYDWVNTEHSVNYFSDVIRSRQKLNMLNEPLKSLQGRNSQFLQNVRLNIISVKEGHVSDSCYQLILCKHAIYTIQFSVEQLISDPTPVLQTIQKHLCKIRCYASTSVRVYLIGTQDSDFSCNVCEIGKVLHDRFSATYGKMLQYNARTNMPCFVVTSALNNQQKVIPHGNLKLSGDTCSENSSFEPQKQHNDQLHCAQLYNVQEVVNHISKVAIGQEFIETSYPYRYLQLHKQVHHMRVRRSKCVSPIDLSLNCNDAERSLTYLHDSGEIINAGNLVFPFSTSATPNYLIMIDPQHLLKAACTISNAPPEAKCCPQDYNSWRDLKTHARAEKRFLAVLAGGKYEVDFLEVMSVIHCLQRCDYRGVDSVNNGQKEMYLVPVYLPDFFPGLDPYVKRKLHQQLCIDFEGFIPDGLFLRSAMFIIQGLKPSRVGWTIRYHNSIHVQIPGKCEFVMECDGLKGIITVNAMWDDPFSPLNLLSFLTKIFNKFKSAMRSRKLKFLIGPPCPLSCDECRQRRGIDWKTHVVDLSLYSQHSVLMCGQERIDKHEHVSPWVQKKSSISIPQMPDDMMKYLSSRTLVQDLPAKVTQIICDRLNGHDPLHRNWEGLAALLDYTFIYLDIMRNEPNPTMALLRDYSRQQNATLGQIFQHFEQLGRRDIIRVINDTYVIVE